MVRNGSVIKETAMNIDIRKASACVPTSAGWIADILSRSVTLHRDLDLSASLLEPGERVTHAAAHQRGAWLHVARGRITLNERTLDAGDGAAISSVGTIEIEGAHT